MGKKVRCQGFYGMVKAGGMEGYAAEVIKRRESGQSEPATEDSDEESPREDRAAQTELALKLLHEASEKDGAVGAWEFFEAGVRNHEAQIGKLRRRGFGIENLWWTNDRSRRYPAYRLLFDPDCDVVRRRGVK